MAWYKQGTITLQSGSHIVLGFGTSWRSDVIPGEGLDAPDGRIYEISEVINNTELRLVDVFVGESIVGAGYQVIPNASMTKELTRRVNALLTTHEKSTAEVMQAAEKAVENAAAAADTADKAAELAVEKAKVAADSADQAEVYEKSAAISKASSAVDSDRAMAYRNEANAAKVIAQESAGVASSAQVSAEKARDEAAGFAAEINPDFMRDRANHIGLQEISTVAGLSDALCGMRNKIINGAFQINQRSYVSGATTAAGQYTLDRWKVTGSGGIAFSRTENKVTVTIPTGQTLQQVIEGLNLQSGNYVLSWEGSAQGRVGSGAYGASGSVTASVLGGTNTVIEFGAGTVSNVQFEIGLVPSPFEQKTIAIETIECQRYSEPTRIHIVGPAPSAGSYIGHRVFFKVTKRAIPTLSSAANPANFNTGGATANDVRVDGFNVYATALAAGALAEYSGDIFASAEL